MSLSVKQILKSVVITSIFILSINSESVFADTHDFKYTPTDQGNLTATISGATTQTDSNGQQYWLPSSASSFVESSITWNTQNYVYVIQEGSSTPLYNQSYIHGTSTYLNLSFYASSGHAPDKVNTFLVDGKYISVYRFYTLTGLSIPNFGINLAFGVTSPRIYGLIPSNAGSIPVTDQASMYQYLNTFFDNSTHIVGFTPADGSTVASSSPVSFSLDVYINPADVGTVAGVRIKFHNIDQNTLISALSSDDIVFYEAVSYTSGAFHFASSTYLTAGNYRIEASLDRSLAWGLLRNPFSSINEVQSHQFIVGASTFLGNISQNSFTQMQTIYNTYNGTSTQSLSTSCNVLSGFDTMRCVAFLFVPSNEQLYDTMNSFRAGFLQRAPWGYLNRMYTIWSTASTSSLPTITIKVPMGNATDYATLTTNFGDMLVGGVAQLNSVTSPREGKTIRQVLELPVQLLIAIAVLFTIITDLAGTHRHDSGGKHTT
jgi:hypothetical protein